MASVIEKAIDALSSSQLQDWISGKTSPTIKTDNKVTVDPATLKTAGIYIFSGFITSALIIGLFIVIAIKSAVKPLYRQ